MNTITTTVLHHAVNTIDEAYNDLFAELAREPHGDDCAYRCLQTYCRSDHACDICGELTDNVGDD